MPILQHFWEERLGHPPPSLQRESVPQLTVVFMIALCLRPTAACCAQLWKGQIEQVQLSLILHLVPQSALPKSLAALAVEECDGSAVMLA